MKLLLAELQASALTQGFRPTKNVNIEAIRPHLYRHNFATGSLKLQIYDSTPTLIATSETLNISAIGSAAYFHGYVRFYINASLLKNHDYTLKLVGQDGYSFNESAYMGWVSGLDLGKYALESTPTTDVSYPFDYEIWERSQG